MRPTESSPFTTIQISIFEILWHDNLKLYVACGEIISAAVAHMQIWLIGSSSLLLQSELYNGVCFVLYSSYVQHSFYSTLYSHSRFCVLVHLCICMYTAYSLE